MINFQARIDSLQQELDRKQTTIEGLTHQLDPRTTIKINFTLDGEVVLGMQTPYLQRGDELNVIMDPYREDSLIGAIMAKRHGELLARVDILEVKVSEENHRLKLMLNAKNRWQRRALSAELRELELLKIYEGKPS